ncbi:MAG TPA: MgtC/SapB family protein [bacterium]|nr:MgtC/SapB family protein [bacterium]
MWQTDVVLLRLLVAAALGGLIGLERERAEMLSGSMFAGVRTFPLFSLLGAVLVAATGGIGLVPAVGFAAVATLVIISYVRTSLIDIGVTTETAALATYWIGALAGAGHLVVAGVLGIAMTVLLASKQRLEALSRTLSPEEVRAALLFAVIAVVVLPLLPDARYGPWGVWNPRELWGIVVIVSGLSFAAFIGMRVLGARRGLYASGLLGGLISSTAVTVSLAARSREEPERSLPMAASAGMASLVMVVRVGVLAAIAGPAVLPFLTPFLVALFLGGALVIGLLLRRAPVGDMATGVSNPFRLDQAIRFSLVFAGILLAVEAAARYLGTWGVLAASAIAGLIDVSAITLALATAANGELTVPTAGTAIAAAVLSNTVAKALYALWMGHRSFSRAIAVVLAVAFAAGVAALVATEAVMR